MPTDELVAHVRDILECCGVPAGQANTVAVDRLNLAIRLAVAAERERCAGIAQSVADLWEGRPGGYAAGAKMAAVAIRSGE